MDSYCNDTDTSATIVPVSARALPDAERLRALPRHFGPHLLTFENAVYQFMRRFASTYRGGIWEFFELSNGGFYMAPEDHAFRLRVDSNGYEGEMSADAAGITVCLFAYSHLSFQKAAASMYADHFHRLREFAAEHAEAREIFAAID